MTYKLIAVAAFSLALGTSAMAQTDSQSPSAAPSNPAQSNMPAGWEGAVGDAFFSNPGTMRSQEEIQANWQNLTEEQQAQVRADCATMDTAAAGTATDAQSGGVSGDAGQADDGMTTSSTTPDAGGQNASLQQVCDWVDTM